MQFTGSVKVLTNGIFFSIYSTRAERLPVIQPNLDRMIYLARSGIMSLRELDILSIIGENIAPNLSSCKGTISISY